MHPYDEVKAKIEAGKVYRDNPATGLQGDEMNPIAKIWKGEPVIFGGIAVQVEGSPFPLGVGCGPKPTTRWNALKSWVRYYIWKCS